MGFQTKERGKVLVSNGYDSVQFNAGVNIAKKLEGLSQPPCAGEFLFYESQDEVPSLRDRD